MVRTQIQLTDGQAAGLKRLAVERGVSMAALIREAVDRTLAEGDMAARHRRALAVAGKFRSGRSDVSERHDDYLADAFWR
ncbi:MAG: ribbon-helix-helix domain-containing protein [Actinomycetota bacterium]|nr:ribbon-helix-helix domain-containing protein [Actinomycetota bacterium]